MLANFSK